MMGGKVKFLQDFQDADTFPCLKMLLLCVKIALALTTKTLDQPTFNIFTCIIWYHQIGSLLLKTWGTKSFHHPASQTPSIGLDEALQPYLSQDIVELLRGYTTLPQRFMEFLMGPNMGPNPKDPN